jgi:hypothetical protein
MVNPHTTDPFAPVVLGLGTIVGAPAIALLTPSELVPTLTATPFRQAVSAIILLSLVLLIAFWIVSRVSIRTAAAVEGGDD